MPSNNNGAANGARPRPQGIAICLADFDRLCLEYDVAIDRPQRMRILADIADVATVYESLVKVENALEEAKSGPQSDAAAIWNEPQLTVQALLAPEQRWAGLFVTDPYAATPFAAQGASDSMEREYIRGGNPKNRGEFSKDPGPKATPKVGIDRAPGATNAKPAPANPNVVAKQAPATTKQAAPQAPGVLLASQKTRQTRPKYTDPDNRIAPLVLLQDYKNAGGTVKLEDGSTIEIKAAGVEIGQLVKGKLDRDDNGDTRTQGVIQFQAKSSNCDNTHWIQFHKESEFDARGQSVPNGRLFGKELYLNTDEWYIDAPATIPGQANPDLIYYDYDNPKPDQRNAFERTKDSVSIFDTPRTELGKSATSIVTYRSYLVSDGKVRWVISWDFVGRKEKGKETFSVENVKGHQTDKFENDLNNKQWDAGTHIESVPGLNGKVKVISLQSLHDNPFFVK